MRFHMHAMKENVISRMLRDVVSPHAPARHSASHDHEKCRACPYEYGGYNRYYYYLFLGGEGGSLSEFYDMRTALENGRWR